MPPPRKNAYNLVVCDPKVTKLKLKSSLWTRIKSESFVKIVQTSDPWWANVSPKYEIFTVLGAVFPHFCPCKHEV